MHLETIKIISLMPGRYTSPYVCLKVTGYFLSNGYNPCTFCKVKNIGITIYLKFSLFALNLVEKIF